MEGALVNFDRHPKIPFLQSAKKSENPIRKEKNEKVD